MQHHHSHRELVKAKTIHVFVNGDLFFEAKTIVVHPKTSRTFEALLIRLTEILTPRFGAVLHLKTADGSSEIKTLEELQDGASYVAYAKKFQRLDYSEISHKLQSLANPSTLTSPRELKRLVVSGRARKIVRHPIIINVYTNGEPLKPAKRVLLQPWVHRTWENVLEQIAAKVSLRSALRKLIDLNTKQQISFGADLQDQQFYVAVGAEKFKDFEYGLNHTMFSPKQQMAKRYPTLPPIEPKGKQDGKQKANLSAPAEKSSEGLQPRPPDHKKPGNESTEQLKAYRKPIKLRSPSPEKFLSLEETKHTSSSKTVPVAEPIISHRVSPILEQKTPSSSITADKDETNDKPSRETFAVKEEFIAAEANPEPSKVESPQPSKVESPQPSKVESPQPSKVESPQPSKVESPQPSKVESPQPGKVESPQPSKVESPQPSKVESPEPDTTARQASPSPRHANNESTQPNDEASSIQPGANELPGGGEHSHRSENAADEQGGDEAERADADEKDADEDADRENKADNESNLKEQLDGITGDVPDGTIENEEGSLAGATTPRNSDEPIATEEKPGDDPVSFDSQLSHATVDEQNEAGGTTPPTGTPVTEAKEGGRDKSEDKPDNETTSNSDQEIKGSNSQRTSSFTTKEDNNNEPSLQSPPVEIQG